MKIPHEINILGEIVKIKLVKNLKDKNGKGIDGQYHPVETLIEIESELKGRKFAHAFFHEYFHAVCDIVGLHNLDFSHDAEELLGDNLARDLSKHFIFRFRD